MNKREIADYVAQQTQLSGRQALLAVNATLGIISRSISEGQRVALAGFGVFKPIASGITPSPTRNKSLSTPGSTSASVMASSTVRGSSRRQVLAKGAWAFTPTKLHRRTHKV